MGCLVARYWKIGIKNCQKRKLFLGLHGKWVGKIYKMTHLY